MRKYERPSMGVRVRIALGYTLGFIEGAVYGGWWLMAFTIVLSFTIDYIWRYITQRVEVPARLKELTRL